MIQFKICSTWNVVFKVFSLWFWVVSLIVFSTCDLELLTLKERSTWNVLSNYAYKF
jgi:hypothetical protein